MQFHRHSDLVSRQWRRGALLLVVIVVACSLPVLALRVQAEQSPEYISPVPGSALVSAGTTIALRYGPSIDSSSLRDGLFEVTGALSGRHAGQIVLSDDQSTVIFKPDQPFAPGEEVAVKVGAGMHASGGEAFADIAFDFRISPQSVQPRLPLSVLLADESAATPAQSQASSGNQIVSNFLTLSPDFPNYMVTIPANGTGDGDLFLAPFSFVAGVRPYLMILDTDGQPLYFQPLITGTLVTDFKRQPNGQLTYFDSELGYYVAMDRSYNPVDSYQAGNGYPTDPHDLQFLPNGHALLIGYDDEPVDMSAVVPGGSPTATVEGLILQELDTSKNVVFQWRSWDHFNITDTTESLTGTFVDYVHANAVELDHDGNLLLSSRHMDEVTKINHSTGDIIWRLGGKNDQFTWTNDPQKFLHQHDIRRLPNGNITLWDNHNGSQPPFSRAVEYQLDEALKTATLVWQYRNIPDAFAFAMGDIQRLPNGNSVTGWGTSSTPSIIEVKPDNTKAFELSLQPPLINYRAFRFPWQGFPTTDPTLVATTTGVTTTLAYSWNGATEIASYRVYGGDSVYPNTLLAVRPRTGFEDHTILVGLQGLYCYFRVMPIDNRGLETRYSNEVHITPPCQPQKNYLPFVSQ